MKLPDEVREQVRDSVYKYANTNNYLHQNRTENNKFLDVLCDDADVGGILNEYMSKGKIRTYIKDAILNRYSKELKELPNDVSQWLSNQYPNETIYDIQYWEKYKASLHRLTSNRFVLVGRTGYLKWETGLRKILICRAQLPNWPPTGASDGDLVLIIFNKGGPVNQGEKQVTEKAFTSISVNLIWAD